MTASPPSALADAPPRPSDAAQPLIPSAAGRRRGGRVAAWIAIGAGILVAALLGVSLFGGQPWAKKAPLDPESAAPDGARAIVQLLEQHGVRVDVVRDTQSALDALHATAATLAMPDSPYLSDARLRAVADAAADAVVIDPRARSLRTLFHDSRPAGFATGALAPACDLPAANRAGVISVAAIAVPGDGVSVCYPSGDAAALLRVDRASGPLSALDGKSLLANEHLAEHGNAALAMNLLGTRATLVWFMPSIDDSDLSAPPTLGSLTPEWVSPVIVLLLVAGVAAGIWRGRRFGPLVEENLPVTVRIGETAAGRARLYARSGDAGHALAQLRHGARGRLARLLGLPPSASAASVADAVAARLGADPRMVHAILIDTVPAGDRDLARLAADLRDLEDAVHAAVRPEGTTNERH
ncbi:DUF4350 domain-containing protein [Microbacterium candidum]|uniref:DUF4350 domain-containing protein n=1 Tax=Microbacterium candidum TaxID=3041922 RepID=A0ABT7N0W9_9MICO|nr:DUF4350 domain-containing protein [Microbacterium sp. ASV49]MDL9980352.1 DUF4350 domain-containing protein [Microbacterium sp. ASV49]